MPRERDLIADNIELLMQIGTLIEGIDDEAYVSPPAGLLQAGIGSHLRHCLDFYECFLRGLALGQIDYDKRERDTECESNRRAALLRISDIVSKVSELDRSRLDTSCQVRLEAQGRGDDPASSSTLRRELQFLVSHTVHHYALVAVILRSQGREVPHEFGVAPSSLAHWAQIKSEQAGFGG